MPSPERLRIRSIAQVGRIAKRYKFQRIQQWCKEQGYRFTFDDPEQSSVPLTKHKTSTGIEVWGKAHDSPQDNVFVARVRGYNTPKQIMQAFAEALLADPDNGCSEAAELHVWFIVCDEHVSNLLIDEHTTGD